MRRRKKRTFKVRVYANLDGEITTVSNVRVSATSKKEARRIGLEEGREERLNEPQWAEVLEEVEDGPENT